MFGWLFSETEGIAADGYTPVLALALTAGWLVSVRLGLLGAGANWRTVPRTLFGWTWLGFGIAFVARFWVIAVDAVTYGDLSGRLATMPSDAVNGALALAFVYWLAVALAYYVVRAPRMNPLTPVARFVHPAGGRVYDAVTVIAATAIVFVGLGEEVTPAGLVRPLGLISSLWVCAAAAAWAVSLGRPATRSAFHIRRWVYLAPGALSFVFEPYRERLLLLAVIPLVAALFAGYRVRLATVLASLAAFGLASTLAVATYRAVSWEGQRLADTTESLNPAVWRSDPYYAPWSAILRRFHSFDSLLFFVYLVPEVIPFETERNPLVDAAIEGFVPRALYPEKPESRRARIFSIVFWSYGDRMSQSEANIAPSMAGDLYAAGDWHWLTMGGLCWGLLLGLLDRWCGRLAVGGQTLVICYLALLAAGGIERDFARATATILQNVIVLVGVTTVLGRVPSVALGVRAERSS